MDGKEYNQTATPNSVEEILEMKIVLWWIKMLAARSSVGQCGCGAIFAITDEAPHVSLRKALLKSAPDPVVLRWSNKYDFKKAKMK